MDEKRRREIDSINEKQDSAETAKKKLSRRKTVVLIGIAVLIWIGAVQVFAAERYEAVVNVVEGENAVGVNPLVDKLDFGDLSRDTGASRFVTLKNTGRSRRVVRVYAFGEIAELMKISEKKFVLHPGEEKKIEFYVRIPVSAPYRHYEGRVYIFKLPF